MSGHHLQQRAHRRQAHLNRGLFDPQTTSSDDDFLTWLFPPDDSSSTASSSSSTSPIFPPLITTGVSDPFSTTADSLTTSTSSSTQSTSTSTSTSSTIPSTTSSSSSITSVPPSSTMLTTRVTVSATSAAASSTNSVAPTGATNAGKIVGGVGAGLVGVAALIALLAFFLRRTRRRRDEDANVFDPSSFRRSAVLMQDPPTHQDTIAAGYNPRNPPPMIERRPPTFGTMYGAPGPNHNAFSPVSPYGAHPYGYTPDTHTDPFMSPIQSPFSPVGPAVNPFSDAPPVLTRMPSAATSALSRQPSGRNNENSIRDSGTVQYIDLDRSSAPPALQIARAQYVEVPGKQSADTPAQDVVPPVPQKDVRTSSTWESQSDDSIRDLEFPTPPSPALTSPSKYGVSMTPPVLPEISIRGSGYGFPSPVLVSQFPSGVTDVATAQTVTMNNDSGSFPVTPSPMASSFQLTPGPDEREFTPSASLSVPPTARVQQKRPETVYDIDEAYGGF